MLSLETAERRKNHTPSSTSIGRSSTAASEEDLAGGEALFDPTGEGLDGESLGASAMSFSLLIHPWMSGNNIKKIDQAAVNSRPIRSERVWGRATEEG